MTRAENDTKINVRIVFTCVFLTLAGLGGRWALMPLFRPPQGLWAGAEADLIRDRYPHHLVDPSALNMKDDEFGGAWVLVETRARTVAVIGGLVVCAVMGMGGIVWFRRGQGIG